MSAELEATRPRQGISVIFWLLVGAFAIAAAVLGAGEASRVAIFAVVFIGWMISLCLHEWGHAASAWAGGDRSVEERGYLTLNPLLYAHPVTSVVLPLIILALGGIGFPGGAVYVRTGALRGATWRAIVSAAGPAMNLACLIVIALFLQIFAQGDLEPSPLTAALALLAFLQATALILNLLPVPGLDGFGILQAFLSPETNAVISRFAPIVMIIFLVAIISMPALFAPLFMGAVWLCKTVGIDVQAIAAGFETFRFWEAPADPMRGS